MYLVKWSYESKLHPSLFFTFLFPSLLLIVVRFKFFYLYKICKQKGLNSKVDDMATITDLPMLYILLNFFLVVYITLYYSTKSIIWASVISNNSPKLLYDTVIFKD